MQAIAISLLWIIALITLMINPKNNANRWGSGCIFLSGLTFLLEQFHWHEYQILITILYPYSLLMFSMSFTGLCSGPPYVTKYWRWIFLLPPLFLLLLYYFVQIGYFNFPLFPYWILYIIVADFLLIYSYIATKNLEIKQERLKISFIVLPVTIFQLGYAIYAEITHNSIFALNLYNCLLFVILFGIILIKHGLLGSRLRLERLRLTRAMRALNSGTYFINHIMKNELLNMAICLENIEGLTKNSTQDLRENLQFIRNSINCMLAMATRISGPIREISLNETPTRLIGIIEQSLNRTAAMLQSKNITVTKEYLADTVLICDPVHLQEVFFNSIKNAIEAMDENGNLAIRTDRDTQWLIVTINDTGVGISAANLARIFDPFFSTKNCGENLGLGLSYCYQVMQKHDGLINVHSKTNKGTTVFLNFSASKISVPCTDENYSDQFRSMKNSLIRILDCKP